MKVSVTLELTFEFEASYSPGTPDVMNLPNGDPGYPGTSPEWDIESLEDLYYENAEGKHSLFVGAGPATKFVLSGQICNAIHGSPALDTIFAEAVSEEFARSEPDYPEEREYEKDE